MTIRPRVFVGSSSEAAQVDRQVRSVLEALQATAVGWRKVFRPGDYALESLLGLGTTVDAALLIVTPDDLTTFRGTERMSPRDNVLLELGMFLSHFGKRRTGILHVKTDGKVAALPSDLHGITTLVFDEQSPSRAEEQLALWLDGVRQEMAAHHPALNEAIDTLRHTVRTVPRTWRSEIDRYVVNSFVSTLKLAARGQIVLTPGQYYQALYEEMDKAAAPYEVLGVVTLSSALWIRDPDQRTYIDKNVQALRRGASIRRLFIVPDHEWPTFYPVARLLLAEGFSIRRAKPTVLAEATALEDMVIFLDGVGGATRAFVADYAFNDPSKIRRGRLILDADDRGDLREAFERVWVMASPITLRDLTESPPDKTSPPEPGLSMKDYTLGQPVVTCEQAAAAKGIPLANELKTLILSTQKGFLALHLPGDAPASLRSVKNALEVDQARLASDKDLRTFGLMPGTVCAVKDPVWSMPHLISRRLLKMDFVSTNNGTHRGFYRFHPSILLEAKSVMIGQFESQPADPSKTSSG
ncbi:MAG: nucleotide-binding protein [Polyangiaceae bacterium]|nr:nucleotide-binding protein [Polyangiaceae bacterium]